MLRVPRDRQVAGSEAQRLSRRRLIGAGGAVGSVSLLAAACAPQQRKSSSTATTAGGAVKRGGTLTTVANSGAIPGQDFDVHGATASATNIQPLFAVMHSGLLRLKVGDGYKYTDRSIEELSRQPGNNRIVRPWSSTCGRRQLFTTSRR